MMAVEADPTGLHVPEQQKDDEQKRRAADKFRARVETVGWFINKVGLGATLALLLGYLLYQIFTGNVQIKVPIQMTDATDENSILTVVPSAATTAEHDRILQELNVAVGAMTKSHEAQTSVLVTLVEGQKEVTLVLRNMRCDMKPTLAQRERCFRRVALGGVAGSVDE